MGQFHHLEKTERAYWTFPTTQESKPPGLPLHTEAAKYEKTISCSGDDFLQLAEISMKRELEEVIHYFLTWPYLEG